MRKSITLGMAWMLTLSTSLASASGIAGAAFQGNNLVYIQGAASNTSTNYDNWAFATLPSGAWDQTPTVKIHVYNNGQTLTCTLRTRNIDTGSLSTNTTSTTISGQITLNLSLSLTYGPKYSHAAFCLLPKQLGIASATIFAASIT